MIDAGAIKLKVLRTAFGICALSEADLFRRLEDFYVEAYRQGADDVVERVRVELNLPPPSDALAQIDTTTIHSPDEVKP